MTERKPDNLGADLSAYLDGELDEQRQREVERQLAESADARRMLDELRAVSDQLGTLPRLRAPVTLTAVLADEAESRLLAPVQTPGRRMRTLRLFAQVTAVAAAVAACVFIGYEIHEYPGQVPKKAIPTATRVPPTSESPAGVLAEAEKPSSLTKSMGGRSPSHTTAKKLVSATESTAAAGVPAAEATRQSLGAPAAVAYSVSSPEDETPSVNIVIATRNDDEYRRAAVMLAEWSDEIAAAAKDSASSEKQEAIENVYHLGATELPTRIDQLAQNVATPSQVRVQLNFNAGRAGILAQTGQPAAAGEWASQTALPAESLADGDGIAEPEAKAAPPVAGGGVYAARAKSAEGPNVTKERPLGESATPPAGAPAAAALPRVEKKGAAAPATPKGAPSERAGGGRGAGRGVPPADQSFDDKRDEETMARDLHERHQAATSEPNLTIVLVEPPDSQFAARQMAPAEAGLAPEPSSQPVRVQELGDSAQQRESTNRLLELLFPGMSPMATRQMQANYFDRDTASAGEQITLRVTLLPPPVVESPATPAATAPTQPQP